MQQELEKLNDRINQHIAIAGLTGTLVDKIVSHNLQYYIKGEA